ncbi:hypothetical protein EMIT0P43_190030 [Pseudomonas jessenii]
MDQSVGYTQAFGRSLNSGYPDKPVGASLLAITECQSTMMLPDPPLSRASSLPQEIV